MNTIIIFSICLNVVLYSTVGILFFKMMMYEELKSITDNCYKKHCILMCIFWPVTVVIMALDNAADEEI